MTAFAVNQKNSFIYAGFGLTFFYAKMSFMGNPPPACMATLLSCVRYGKLVDGPLIAEDNCLPPHIMFSAIGGLSLAKTQFTVLNALVSIIWHWLG